jgi:Predicted membrane protein
VRRILSLSTSSHDDTAADPDRWGLGLLAALLAGFCYGTYSYAIARIIRQGYAPLATAGAVFGAASLPLFAVALFGGSALLTAGSDLVGLGYLIAGPMVMSYLLYTWAMRSLKSSAVLLISLVEPAVATLLAVWIVEERFDLQGGLGIALIALAVILAGRRSPATDKPETS